MESKRVRTARALDEIEECIWKLCGYARKQTECATHWKNELLFDMTGMLEDAARKYEIGVWDLKHDALQMLKEGLKTTLNAVQAEDGCYGSDVYPYMKDGECVGMTARFYLF